MTYKEMNEFCKNNNVYGSQFYIAEELRDAIEGKGITIEDNRFEELCSFILATYQHTASASIYQLCWYAAKLEEEGEDALSYTRSDFAALAYESIY